MEPGAADGFYLDVVIDSEIFEISLNFSVRTVLGPRISAIFLSGKSSDVISSTIDAIFR